MRFASDLFIEWSTLLKHVENRRPVDDERIFVFAVRKNGVDDENFFINSLYEINKYNKIFFVNVRNEDNQFISVELKDMTDKLSLSDINRLNEAKIQNEQTVTADDDLPFE